MRKNIVSIVFIVYVVIINTIFYEKFNDSLKVYPNLTQIMLDTFIIVVLSFSAAIIFSLNKIIDFFMEGSGKLYFSYQNFIFFIICIFISLMKIWIFTIFSHLQIPNFLDFYFLEVLLAFAAGLFFIKTFQKRKDN